MKKKFWGLLLLVLGVLVLLQVMGLFNFGLSFWPVVLLLLGFFIVWENASYGFKSWFFLALGLWVGAIGLLYILQAAAVTTIGGGDMVRYGWPLLLVAIGLSILFGNQGGWFGSWTEKDGTGRHATARMRHIGDLYHGRGPWILDADQEFYHGVGDVVIDLTTAEIKVGSHRIFIKAGIGEVTVRVPDGINIKVDASVGIGELELFGEQRSGIGGLSLHREIDLAEAVATVELEVRLGIGELTVVYLPAIPGVK